MKKNQSIFPYRKKVITFFTVITFGLLSIQCSNSQKSNPNNEIVINERDIVLGNPQAKTVVVEYYDLQCPACASFNQVVFKKVWRIIQQDVKWVFRNFPLQNIHPYATLAANYNQAAFSQGKYLEFHDVLFVRQKEWSTLPNKEEVKKKFIAYAEELGLDKVLLQREAESATVREKINQDIESGNQLGVQGTPSIFLDGEKINLPRSAEDFFKTIVAKVKKSN